MRNLLRPMTVIRSTGVASAKVLLIVVMMTCVVVLDRS